MSSSYKPLTTNEKADMVEVPISPPAAVVVVEEPRGRCFTNSCCGCFSLATGIAILACFDLVSGITQVFSVIAVLVARTHEHALDEALVKVMSNSTAAVVDSHIKALNYGIDVAAEFTPMLLLMALVTIAAGIFGMRASKGCACSARKFYAWKLATAMWVSLSVLFGKPSGLLQCMMAIYFAVVARSFWLKLEFERAVLPTTAPETPSAPAPTPAVTSGHIAIVGVGAPVN